MFGTGALEGLDGELIYGPSTSPTVYRDTNSFVMSIDKECPASMITFWVFDKWNRKNPFKSISFYDVDEHESVRIVPMYWANNADEVLEYEKTLVDDGYEGLILRNPEAPYKFGRTTMKEENTYKLKRFEDSEGTIIGMIEELHNGNEAQTNELGRTKRSTAKAGMTGKGTMGALVVSHPGWPIAFNIGSGFSAAERKSFWEDKERIIGSIAKFKYFPIGCKDAPRHPIFLGFRDEIDL
jgi:DNA ligase-1